MAKIKRTPSKGSSTNKRGLAAKVIVTVKAASSNRCIQPRRARNPPTYLTQDQNDKVSGLRAFAAPTAISAKPGNDSKDDNNNEGNDNKEGQKNGNKDNDSSEDKQGEKKGGSPDGKDRDGKDCGKDDGKDEGGDISNGDSSASMSHESSLSNGVPL